MMQVADLPHLHVDRQLPDQMAQVFRQGVEEAHLLFDLDHHEGLIEGDVAGNGGHVGI